MRNINTTDNWTAVIVLSSLVLKIVIIKVRSITGAGVCVKMMIPYGCLLDLILSYGVTETSAPR